MADFLNCLIPFLVPSNSISVQEAGQVSVPEFVEKTFNASPSLDSNTRNEMGKIFQNHLMANNQDPRAMLPMLFNAAKNACAVDRDRAVFDYMQVLVENLLAKASHGQQAPQVSYQPQPQPQPHQQPHPNTNQSWAAVAGQGGPPAVVRPAAEAHPNSSVYAKPLFFPSEDSFKNLIKSLESARNTLDVCVFNITDDSLASVLANAHKRGVKVRIITDDDQMKSLGSDVLRLNRDFGIPYRTDSSTYHMHNKFAIVDDSYVVNGSYNWTKGARYQNQENIIITNAPEAISGFRNEFEKLWAKFNGTGSN
ncbi:phospholipase D/nuclease [Basidiobolus meristosporus CBS 931.73]|uniref:Mitochondrial cardiolipin hydrolase n=1 Tax=Basidiobolus meristosporus CBS 931.73 TaxID=1314790 RepID=A0A1Y1ZBG5_9FUNG|nr:phospholipase D/nuclease [Basidiobolus meristosporus CBS 931.73]|eukprot:ORY07632.1 phospholipase D/nuclease [Basidiobolus meristosporus CBS 931.73]